eukprot:gene12835-7185_t
MSKSICATRLVEERKAWRKDHPVGFYARPSKGLDGSQDITKWECGVPGKQGTIWEGGEYKVVLYFPSNYPVKPPICKFEPAIFHPNVYDDGKICLSIINEYENWKPSITVKQILVGIQDLLNNPNPKSPAQSLAYELYTKNKKKYEEKIRLFAKQSKPKE